MSEISDSFIMYLPSDSNLELNPDNKPSNFTVQLNDALYLNRKMEVGIIEIILTEPDFKLYEHFEFHIVWCYENIPSQIDKWDFNEHRIKTFKLPRKIYNTKLELLNEMKKMWTDFQTEHSDQKQFYVDYFKEKNVYKDSVLPKFGFNNLKFGFNNLKFDIIDAETGFPNVIWKNGDIKHSRRFIERKIDLSNAIMLLFQFDKRLYKSMEIEGNDDIMTNHIINEIVVSRFGGDRNLNQKFDVFKYNLPEIKKPLNDINLNSELDILIICDIVEESYMNDKKLNYLLHAKCKQAGNTFIKVDNPIYFPLNRDIINSINIKVVDLSGDEIIFESGVVIFTLSFRPKEII
jgi:hypothetical protein